MKRIATDPHKKEKQWGVSTLQIFILAPERLKASSVPYPCNEADKRPQDPMLIKEIFLWLNTNGVIVGLCTFLLGTLFGHRLNIFRDDRNRRISEFSRIATAVANQERSALQQSDVDTVLSLCGRWRRSRMAGAMNDYRQASDSYFDGKAALGSQTSSLESKARMGAAKHNLVKLLRS